MSFENEHLGSELDTHRSLHSRSMWTEARARAKAIAIHEGLLVDAECRQQPPLYRGTLRMSAIQHPYPNLAHYPLDWHAWHGTEIQVYSLEEPVLNEPWLVYASMHLTTSQCDQFMRRSTGLWQATVYPYEVETNDMREKDTPVHGEHAQVNRRFIVKANFVKP